MNSAEIKKLHKAWKLILFGNKKNGESTYFSCFKRTVGVHSVVNSDIKRGAEPFH